MSAVSSHDFSDEDFAEEGVSYLSVAEPILLPVVAEAEEAGDGFTPVNTSRGTATQKLMRMAAEMVVPVKADDGSLMAASAHIPHLVFAINGLNCEALVPVFLRYVNTYGKPAPKEAMNSLRSLMEMQAVDSDRIPVHQRAAWDDDVVWLDTGWADGSVIRIDARG